MPIHQVLTLILKNRFLSKHGSCFKNAPFLTKWVREMKTANIPMIVGFLGTPIFLILFSGEKIFAIVIDLFLKKTLLFVRIQKTPNSAPTSPTALTVLTLSIV